MANWRFYLNGFEVEEPLGWDAIEFTAVRSELHGIDQPFSTTLQFYEYGAFILKEAFDTKFTGAEVSILIDNGAGFTFSGFIDFSTYEEINTCDTDSFSVSVNILEDFFRDRFKARYGAEVDLMATKDLDGNAIPSGFEDFEQIRMHGQLINLSAKGGSLAASDVPFGKYTAYWSISEYRKVLPIYWSTNDFTGDFGSAINVTGFNWSNTNCIFQDNSPDTGSRTIRFSWQTFTFQVVFNDYPNPNWQLCCSGGVYNPSCDPVNFTSAVDIWIERYDGSNNSLGRERIYASQIIPWGQNNLYTLTVPASYKDITLPNNGRFQVYVSWAEDRGLIKPPYGDGEFEEPPCTGFFTFGGLLKFKDNIRVALSEKNESTASINDCYPIFSFLRRIIYQITGLNNRLLSDVFSEESDGDFCNHCFTTGLVLRKFVPNNGQYPQVRVSFKKVIENLAVIFNVGWAFEKIDGEYFIRIEPMEYFYRNEIGLVINQPSQLKKIPVTDNLFNELRIGYSDNWKNISIGGADAVCTDRVYYIDNNSIKAGETSKIEKISDIITEGVAIEFSRRLQFFDANASTSDRPNDFTLFMIWLIRKDITTNRTEYLLDGQTGSVALTKYRASYSAGFMYYGGDDNNRYNIFHTPARVALRHWISLGMNTVGVTPPTLQFQVGEYVTNFVSVMQKESVVNFYQPRTLEYWSGNEFNYRYLKEDGDIDRFTFKIQYQDVLFKPVIYEFEYPQSFCDFIQLCNFGGYQKVKVNMGKTSVSGWILEIKNKPEDNSGGTTIFKIIASNLPDPLPPEPLQLGAYASEFSNAYD